MFVRLINYIRVCFWTLLHYHTCLVCPNFNLHVGNLLRGYSIGFREEIKFSEVKSSKNIVWLVVLGIHRKSFINRKAVPNRGYSHICNLIQAAECSLSSKHRTLPHRCILPHVALLDAFKSSYKCSIEWRELICINCDLRKAKLHPVMFEL